MWKFRRNKKATFVPEPLQEIALTPHEVLINGVLDSAISKAKSVAYGESFVVVVDPEEIPDGVIFLQVISPIVACSTDCGLYLSSAENWSFVFVKV